MKKEKDGDPEGTFTCVSKYDVSGSMTISPHLWLFFFLMENTVNSLLPAKCFSLSRRGLGRPDKLLLVGHVLDRYIMVCFRVLKKLSSTIHTFLYERKASFHLHEIL